MGLLEFPEGFHAWEDVRDHAAAAWAPGRVYLARDYRAEGGVNFLFCDELNRFAGVFLLTDGCYGAGFGFLFEFGSHVGFLALAGIHVILG